MPPGTVLCGLQRGLAWPGLACSPGPGDVTDQDPCLPACSFCPLDFCCSVDAMGRVTVLAPAVHALLVQHGAKNSHQFLQRQQAIEQSPGLLSRLLKSAGRREALGQQHMCHAWWKL